MSRDFLLPCILITNDDGIDAPGLKVLAEIAAEFAEDVWIVAPEEDQSGAAQKITLREPVLITKRGEKKWSVKGTPADCVALALDHLMAKDEDKPSLVLSGINATSNVGDEIALSGTVGAAMTALMMGVPAIALSQGAPSRQKVPWEIARAVAPLVLRHLLTNGWKKETVVCVNIPDVPAEKITGFAWARQARGNIGKIKSFRRISPRSEEYYWLSLIDKNPEPQPGSDVMILSRGQVALTALSLDQSVEINKPFLPFNEQDLPDVDVGSSLDQQTLQDILSELESVEIGDPSTKQKNKSA